ncbi:MAG: hypothetical protein FJZ90_00510 [Chloroflexi bacterium]|nr:hypothetical protein [Chloroflexota bacterium]
MSTEQAKDLSAYCARHRAFWSLAPVERPLIVCVVGGWSPFLDQDASGEERELLPGDLQPESALPYYEQLYEMEAALPDDAHRATQPFPAVPWMEAIVGCSIRRAGPHFWAERLALSLDELGDICYDPANLWVRRYLECLDYYAQRFPAHPTGQAILRGPTDLLAAALGDEAAVLSLVERSEEARRALQAFSNVIAGLIKHQWAHTPPFAGGYVIGQYELWAPGPVARLQEDAISLYSPRLYRDLVLPLDEELCGLTPYNLMHLHASCRHLLPLILGNEKLGAVQISKDEGNLTLEDILPALEAIQAAGKPLVVKGRFTEDEVGLMKRHLRCAGLSVQPVVDELAEALGILPTLMEW